MTADRWQRIDEVFQSALDRSPAERGMFLREACNGDDALRAEVESLLAHDNRAADNLHSVVADAADSLDREVNSADLGKKIGVFEVVRELGRGGMGSVYMAVRADRHFLQAVAIKLVRRGMDSEFILKRFRYERQILANLSHPNIAAILDGGTTDDGRPYFVMEYVEGVPIVEYCETHRLLIPERLELFRAVCSAVHHAHQKLVIHRDIKPGNILVTEDGTPKLLDFGIAKLLAPELVPGVAPITKTSVRFMTTDYASPEQIRGDDVTTASDVYSLGALLYELLTGKRAYDFVDRAEQSVENAICFVDPCRPSDVPGLDDRTRRALRGDLDNMVLMAMRKEPSRRYGSVAQFSEDIHRHLHQLPVLARSDSLKYRLTKVAVRYKAAIVAAVLVMVTLLAGLGATLWQARVAERRFNELRKLANSFLFEFHDAIQNLPGSTPARALVVRKALEYLDNLAKEASTDESLLRELATAYKKVGDVQGNVYHSNLGDTAGALQSYQKSVAIREGLARKYPGAADIQRELAASYQSLGDVHRTRGDTAHALEMFNKALVIITPMYEEKPSVPERLQVMTDLHNRIGDLQANMNDTRGALYSYRRVMTAYEQWHAREPRNDRARRGVAVAYLRVGDMLARTGDQHGALSIYQKSLSLRNAAAQVDPSNATLRRDLLTAYNRIGDLLGNPYSHSLGDYKGAQEYYSKALQIAGDLFTADPRNARAAYDLAITYMRLGDLLQETGTPAAQLKMYQDAAVISEAAIRSDPNNVETKYNLVLLKHRAGLVHKAQKRYGEALREMQVALKVIESLAAKDRSARRFLYELGSLRGAIGEVRLASGDPLAALPDFEVHVKWLEATALEDAAFISHRKTLASGYAGLAKVHASLALRASKEEDRRKHWAEARISAGKSVQLWAEVRRDGQIRPSDSSEVQDAQSVLARAEAALH